MFIMALSRLEVRSGPKGKGTPHYNYINAQDKFTAKKIELVAMGGGNMPEFAKHNHAEFWQAAELYERKNGSVYREHILSLPREFTLEQNINFIQEWVEQEIKNHAFSFAIHAPKASDGEAQPHCHLMFCERVNDGIERTAEQFFKRYNSKNPEKGGAKKANTGLSYTERKQQLKEQRSRYGELLNKHLVKNGYEASVDMRNYIERKADKPNNIDIAEFKNRQLLNELAEQLAPEPPTLTYQEQAAEYFKTLAEKARTQKQQEQPQQVKQPQATQVRNKPKL